MDWARPSELILDLGTAYHPWKDIKLQLLLLRCLPTGTQLGMSRVWPDYEALVFHSRNRDGNREKLVWQEVTPSRASDVITWDWHCVWPYALAFHYNCYWALAVHWELCMFSQQSLWGGTAKYQSWDTQPEPEEPSYGGQVTCIYWGAQASPLSPFLPV